MRLFARKQSEREKIPDQILAAIPEDHGISAKEVKANTKRTCGSGTLYHHLPSLIAAGKILKEGSASKPLYRRQLWTGPARLAPLPKHLKSVPSEVKTIDDLFARRSMPV
jgi:hypothetical protein